MRKVTEQICLAFSRKQPRNVGNTMTDGHRIFLHGNKIVQRLPDINGLWLSLAGWNTSTTRERLNGVLTWFDIPAVYHQRQFEPYIWIRNKDRSGNSYSDSIEISADDWLVWIPEDKDRHFCYTEHFSDGYSHPLTPSTT